MRITDHVYHTHIDEDPNTFGAHHPGGTSIYFVGDPAQQMVVVDTGEPYRRWTRQIMGYYEELGRPKIAAILITHGHGDHIGGLDRLQEAWDCPVRCHPKLEPRLTERLGAGVVSKLLSRELIEVCQGVSLRALFSPGHEEDHVCYFMPNGRALFTGDTILGNSSTSVRDLRAYLASLELLARHKPDLICPGHGQVVYNGTSRVQWQIKHRLEREEQVLKALGQGARTVDELVKAVYGRALKRNLRDSAARNVQTHLDKLKGEGRVKMEAASYAPAGE